MACRNLRLANDVLPFGYTGLISRRSTETYGIGPTAVLSGRWRHFQSTTTVEETSVQRNALEPDAWRLDVLLRWLWFDPVSRIVPHACARPEPRASIIVQRRYVWNICEYLHL